MIVRILQKSLRWITARLDRRIYRERDFAIISNNCWGAEIYKRLGLQFNTPFVGLFLYGSDYLKLLERFEHYLSRDLRHIPVSKWTGVVPDYPLGALGDIEIHFLHYRDFREAKLKWERRVARMAKVSEHKLYFKICERDGTDVESLRRFHKLNYRNKISFGLSDIGVCEHVVLREIDKKHLVPDGVALYRISFKYVDVLRWIDTGRMEVNLYSKCKARAGIC